MQFLKKCEKPLFLGILGQNGQFWAIFGQKGAISNFRWKSENVTFLPIFFYFSKQKIRKFQCAVSEKIWRTETTERERETDRDEGEFIGGRRTKKVKRNKNCHFFRKKNAKNLHFLAFWAKKANFGQFLAKMGEAGFFFKTSLGTFFRLSEF